MIALRRSFSAARFARGRFAKLQGYQVRLAPATERSHGRLGEVGALLRSLPL
jgi:hypothetical protein